MSSSYYHSTPQKPPSDLKLLWKFMFWKLFSIDLEVTSEVFEILVIDAVPYHKKFGHLSKISDN